MTASFSTAGSERRAGRLPVRRSSRLASILGQALQWSLVLAAATAALGLGVLPRLGQYRTLTVLSSSMVPTFRPGDMVVVRPEPMRDLRVGQVITYRVPVGARQIETHRVVKIVRGLGSDHPVIQTKGDANTGLDPWTAQLEGTTVWRLEAVIPKAGYAVNALRNRAFHIVALLILPALLALLALRRLWTSDPIGTGNA
jgi:signal peptidase I